MGESISVILPVYNQEKNLTRAIALWTESFEKLKRDYEIVVINDGSTDSTHDVLSMMQTAGNHTYLKVQTQPARSGYGASLRAGLALSSNELILATSLDYAYSPDDLKILLKSLAQKDEYTGKRVSLVSGCRMDQPYLGGRAFRNNLKRYATRAMFGYLPEKPVGLCSAYSASRWWSLRLQFGLRFHDTFSKYKLFRREILDRMVLQSNSEFILAEILAKATFLGYLMDEVAIAQSSTLMPWSAEPAFDADQFSKDRRNVFRKQEFVRKEKPVEMPPEPKAILAE